MPSRVPRRIGRRTSCGISIKTCWHFFKQYVKAGEISLHHCPGTSNPSDILTKAYGAGEGQNNQKAKEFRKNAMFCLGDRYSIQ